MSYPMDDTSWQRQNAYMPSVPHGYEEPNVKQPVGVIQPHVIPYEVHVKQPTAQTVVVVPPQGLPGSYIKDYLPLSILSLICCWPIGIIAIVMSCMVLSRRRDGYLEEAEKYSRWAKNLSIAAIICGMIIIILSIVARAVLLSEHRKESTQYT